ncbi:bidirectional sugar transporter SWEET17-like [Pistacia vera]|uniref:bidirectional sugar transporter SWEET17-like n=1 Tax=Pistacia vera TaxID=55513 RepID=UPI001262B37B|nr:bidirectional sugar transporter SWEET17-like [Pistacia vera]
MANPSFFVGVIGNIIAMLLALSPVKTFWRILQNRSTEEFESLPYVCALLNSMLWTYYGLTKSGEILVVTINVFIVIVETVYLIIFLVYASPRMKAKTALLVGLLDVGFPAAAILIIELLLHGEMKIDVLGFICAVLSIIMFGSPLVAMRTVVMSKSVEYMPFLLSLFVALTGGIWTLYAVLVKDLFLAVPNGVGFLLGVAQLVVYAIFRKPNSSKRLPDGDDIEDEWQHQHLISASIPILQKIKS